MPRNVSQNFDHLNHLIPVFEGIEHFFELNPHDVIFSFFQFFEFLFFEVFGGLLVALIYIIVMFFMNRQTPLNKISDINEIRFFKHNSANSWKQGSCKFWEGQTLADDNSPFDFHQRK